MGFFIIILFKQNSRAASHSRAGSSFPAPALQNPSGQDAWQILGVEKPPLQLGNFCFSSPRKAFGVLPSQPPPAPPKHPSSACAVGKGLQGPQLDEGRSWTDGRWPQLGSACFESHGYLSAGISQPYGCHNNNNCSFTLQTGPAAAQHPQLFPAPVRLSSPAAMASPGQASFPNPRMENYLKQHQN